MSPSYVIMRCKLYLFLHYWKINSFTTVAVCHMQGYDSSSYLTRLWLSALKHASVQQSCFIGGIFNDSFYRKLTGKSAGIRILKISQELLKLSIKFSVPIFFVGGDS